MASCATSNNTLTFTFLPTSASDRWCSTSLDGDLVRSFLMENWGYKIAIQSHFQWRFKSLWHCLPRPIIADASGTGVSLPIPHFISFCGRALLLTLIFGEFTALCPDIGAFLSCQTLSLWRLLSSFISGEKGIFLYFPLFLFSLFFDFESWGSQMLNVCFQCLGPLALRSWLYLLDL